MYTKKFVDKREYIRFNSEGTINLQVQKKDQDQTPSDKVFAITKNLSIKGICFIYDKNLVPGDIIQLEIVLPPQPQTLHLEGQVKWVNSLKPTENTEVFETGVELFTLGENDESRFIEYTCEKTIGRLSQYLHI